MNGPEWHLLGMICVYVNVQHSNARQLGASRNVLAKQHYLARTAGFHSSSVQNLFLLYAAACAPDAALRFAYLARVGERSALLQLLGCGVGASQHASSLKQQ